MGRIFHVILFFIMAETNDHDLSEFKFCVINPGELLISLDFNLPNPWVDESLLSKFAESYSDYSLKPTNVVFFHQDKLYLALFNYTDELNYNELNNFLMMLNSDKSIVSVDRKLAREAITSRSVVTPRPFRYANLTEWESKEWIERNADILVEMKLLRIINMTFPFYQKN